MPTVPIGPDKTLSYRERGSGPPLALLHGFPLDSRIWDRQLSDLSDRFRVIAPDLAGFGDSVPDRPFTIASLAEEVHALLSSLSALPCVLGGLSMGGYAALAFAKRYPRDLRALVLIDTRAEGDNAEGKEKRNQMIALVREKGSRAVADQMLPKMLAPERVDDKALVGRLRQIMESCPPKTIEHACVAMRDRQDFTSDLPSIVAPTLIIVGEKDALTPPQMSETMHRAIPASRMVVVPGSGHMSPMEKPDDVTRAIRDFLSSR